jgi:hypothetical protein
MDQAIRNLIEAQATCKRALGIVERLLAEKRAEVIAKERILSDLDRALAILDAPRVTP